MKNDQKNIICSGAVIAISRADLYNQQSNFTVSENDVQSIVNTEHVLSLILNSVLYSKQEVA